MSQVKVRYAIFIFTGRFEGIEYRDAAGVAPRFSSLKQAQDYIAANALPPSASACEVYSE